MGHNTTRKLLRAELNSAKIHLDTTFNCISLVAAKFSERAFDAAVHGTEIDEDSLDMQGMLADIVDALRKMQEMLNLLAERM